jgi:hypothetical protein
MAREDGFFDDLARGLADDSLTRGKALRLMGAALVGGALGSVGIGEASADPPGCKRNGKNCTRSEQCCSGNCASGTCQAQTTTTSTTTSTSTTSTSTTTPTTTTTPMCLPPGSNCNPASDICCVPGSTIACPPEGTCCSGGALPCAVDSDCCGILSCVNGECLL